MPLAELVNRSSEHIPDIEAINGVIITDCSDRNARARQEARFKALFRVNPTFIGLGEHDPDLEAAGHLVDILDAANVPDRYDRSQTVVEVNVAPRGDDISRRWENGTPFCYTQTERTTVFSAFEGRALALAHRLNLLGAVHLFDIPSVTKSWVENGTLTARQASEVNNSQFRSLEFLPLAAREITAGRILPSEKVEIAEHPEVEGRAWHIDNFSNVKTTLLPEDVDFAEGTIIELQDGQPITCHTRLADVPTGQLGLTIGSSGYDNHRWLEIVKQRGRAADDLGIKIGSKVLKAATLIRA